MNLGKKIMIFGTVTVLAVGGYQLVKNNNPYNNKNITFIHEHLDDYSKTMEHFIEEDFMVFNSMMKDLSQGNYDKFAKTDMIRLDEYMNTILTCNFKEYKQQLFVDRDKSGFVINFQNYFKKGTEEYRLVEWATEQYQIVIDRSYSSGGISFEDLAIKCGDNYNFYKKDIDKLTPFARYIVLKLIRPIIDIHPNNHVDYPINNRGRYNVQLHTIDKKIDDCLQEMKNKCKNTFFGYH